MFQVILHLLLSSLGCVGCWLPSFDDMYVLSLLMISHFFWIILGIFFVCTWLSFFLLWISVMFFYWLGVWYLFGILYLGSWSCIFLIGGILCVVWYNRCGILVVFFRFIISMWIVWLLYVLISIPMNIEVDIIAIIIIIYFCITGPESGLWNDAGMTSVCIPETPETGVGSHIYYWPCTGILVGNISCVI